MTDSIVLTVPEDLAARAKRIAETTDLPVEQVLLDYLRTLSAPLPVEQVLLDHLRTLSAPLPELPPDDQAELDALHQLSDDALWTIAREQMPDEVQRRAQELMERNSRGLLSDPETAELERLVERADRLLLRKAEAAALLRRRGYPFTRQDFKPQDG